MRLRHRPGMNWVLLVSSLAAGPVLAYGAEVTSSDVRTSIGARFEEAKRLIIDGQYAEAAAIYEQVGATDPGTLKAQGVLVGDKIQRAALEAGINYDRAGQMDKAIEQFDRAVSMGISPRWGEAALYAKVVVCEKAGRLADALKSIEYLRLGYPYSEKLPDALNIRGRIEQMSPAQLEAMKATEEQALGRMSAVNSLLLGRPKDWKEALQLIEQIEQEFGNTGAAVAAVVAKGTILHSVEQYDKASEALAPLVDRMMTVAPQSLMAGKARYLLEKSVLAQAGQLLDQGIRNGAKASPDTWKVIRGYCERVLAMGYSPSQTVGAKVILVALELVDRNPAKAELLAEGLMKEYAGAANEEKFAKGIMVLHRLAARAAQLNGKPDKALALTQGLKEMYARLPEDKQREHGVREEYRRACFMYFYALGWTKADPAKIRAAGEDLLARYPDSPDAAVVRMQLGLPASEPAP